MQNEIDIVRDVSARLESASIAYMLTGSMAMNYYAEPRMTRDIDLVLAARPDDATTLVTLFRLDYYISDQAVRESLAGESIFNLIHNESVIKVDCIIRKSSPYRRMEFDRRRRIRISDFETWIASIEDLIISKLVWAEQSRSELQLRDVRNLLRAGCDLEYLERWARELGVFALLEECRA